VLGAERDGEQALLHAVERDASTDVEDDVSVTALLTTDDAPGLLDDVDGGPGGEGRRGNLHGCVEVPDELGVHGRVGRGRSHDPEHGNENP
jgi:hypothetical protein